MNSPYGDRVSGVVLFDVLYQCSWTDRHCDNNDEHSLHGGSRCCDAPTTAGGHIDRCVGLKCVRLMSIFFVLVPSGTFAEFRTAAHSVNCSDA